MTGNWIDELKQSTDKERKEREEINRQRSKEFFDKMRVKANAERDEMNGLMKQVAERNYNDNKLKRDKEIETAKQKAMRQVQSEYESKHGVNTDKTNGINQAWSNLIKDL
ncbi:hypothetical protein [Pseudolactococcus chungangensis]|uniref:hypothetical protein n=1 Tax=Pseudolactococcus chungangensis TaxID=451457 RepID=UPI0028D1489A|nr:hypothetical protein [Lactococcus chungangensis]